MGPFLHGLSMPVWRGLSAPVLYGLGVPIRVLGIRSSSALTFMTLPALAK